MAKDFHHPYKPYDIQQQFMQAVYDCIENGQVGIFESPTGTGKSLSLICGSLTWLREHKRKAFDASMQDVEFDGEPEWVVERAKALRQQEAQTLRAEFEARLEAMRAKEASLRKKLTSEPVRKRAKLEEDDDDLALDDYNSDEEKNTAYSAATTKMLEKLGMLSHEEEGASVVEEEVKVIFCSRTHSQLSQLIGELRQVHLPAAMPSDERLSEDVRQIALGSRKNLCINSKVNKLNSQTAINERCLELQQSCTKAENKCSYLPKQNQAHLLLDFRDMALSKIRDIEDLAAVGKSLEVCPYYASRTAIAPAEVIALPYPLLLQKASREALGISLKGSVVIIDEAHNLINAVESAYATQISDTILQSARSSLIAYLQKYRNRLAGSNRVYVAQLIRLIDSLLAATTTLRGTGGTLQPSILLAGQGVDQINLPKLIRYIHESKIARKVESFNARKSLSEVAETPTLTMLANFMLSLVNPAVEGSFFWSKDADIQLRYLLLDPSQHFKEVVEQSRAVILAGGTMSPMEDHIQQLFPHLAGQVKTLSCGHIVPATSLLVKNVAADTSGPLEYNYKTRSSNELLTRTGRLLHSISTKVKGGMVVFFASYTYLETMHEEWTRTRLFQDQHMFFDGRTQSAEATFEAYSKLVRNGDNAILCSVIGGKLSEGINFSDELGRCVVVVGLPFPNLETPEWKAKIRYLEAQAAFREQKSSLSRDFAENICMRAVNQAIGRAIRHKNDWASIVLIDARYAQARIQNKLPAWIRSSMAAAQKQDTAALLEDMQHFFEDHAT